METIRKKQEEECLWIATWTDAFRHAPAFVARYMLASEYVAGKTVCDVACGAGYGSYYLSQKAKDVTAMDVSQDAIRWATQHYQRLNLKYLHIKADEPWPLTSSFDVVTSFETMEHTISPETFLQNIYEHLIPGGKLVMSVPNGPMDQERNNPFHLHHFTQDQLRTHLEQFFSPIQYLSQIYLKNFKHYAIKPLRKLMGYESHTTGNYSFISGLQNDAKTWIVIASKPGATKNSARRR